MLERFGGWRSVSVALPLKRADTGPTFILAVARKPCSSVFSSSSQPGIQAFRTSGSLSLSHTAWRGAASWTSPFIVMAMAASKIASICSPNKARLPEKEGHQRIACDAYSQPQQIGVNAWGLAGTSGDG